MSFTLKTAACGLDWTVFENHHLHEVCDLFKRSMPLFVHWCRTRSSVVYCSDALRVSSLLLGSSSVHWTVGAGNKHFSIWMTSCAVGPGLWYLSVPPHPSLLCHSSSVSLQPTSSPFPHSLPPPSPSFCPLAHFQPWLEPESRTVLLNLLVNPSPKASWVPSHLPLFPFPQQSLGTATHAPLPVSPSDPHVAPLGQIILVASARGLKPGMIERLVVVGRAAVNWADLRWKLHQWMNHFQLRFTERGRKLAVLKTHVYLSFGIILMSLYFHPS